MVRGSVMGLVSLPLALHTLKIIFFFGPTKATRGIHNPG
jgi:hypothetical protein